MPSFWYLPFQANISGSSPRLDDEVVGLVVAVALLDRRDPVDHVGVHRAAERHAGDQPAAADAVDHGVLLGDPDRRVASSAAWNPSARWPRPSPLVARASAEPIRFGSGHEPVGVLVVLVHADAVQARLGGVDQLVERPVVVLPDPAGIGQLSGTGDRPRPTCTSARSRPGSSRWGMRWNIEIFMALPSQVHVVVRASTTGARVGLSDPLCQPEQSA